MKLCEVFMKDHSDNVFILSEHIVFYFCKKENYKLRIY